ncbi:MAG: response regulator, partial [Flammeovirgaceae bacterium]|nr:response regulator [Flammeovirgaceae bacterium]
MGDKMAFRVLVVDDDKDILDLLKYNLEKEGYKVKTIDDGSKAIQTAKKFKPDLIILDIMM